MVDFEKLSQHEGPKQSPGFLLWKVSTTWRASIEKLLREMDLTHPQFVVLASLGWLTQNGERVPQAAIGRMAGLDPNTLSQIVRGLEKKGHIQREASKDARAKNPTLTPQGAKILKKALPAVENKDSEFFNKLKTKDLKTMVDIFEKLI
ncbi:MAG: MarR family transcriptional regulator [Simkaniaceae bacterium]|nr:MarR family transcriptional regulator [Simkaniaceae bacterium]